MLLKHRFICMAVLGLLLLWAPASQAQHRGGGGGGGRGAVGHSISHAAPARIGGAAAVHHVQAPAARAHIQAASPRVNLATSHINNVNRINNVNGARFGSAVGSRAAFVHSGHNLAGHAFHDHNGFNHNHHRFSFFFNPGFFGFPGWGYSYPYNDLYYNTYPYYGYNYPYYGDTYPNYGYDSALLPAQQGYGVEVPSTTIGGSPRYNDMCAHFEVIVPTADTEVLVNNQPTTSRGETRRFDSPPLQLGSGSTYNFRVSWVNPVGQIVSVERVVAAEPNTLVQIDFTKTPVEVNVIR